MPTIAMMTDHIEKAALGFGRGFLHFALHSWRLGIESPARSVEIFGLGQRSYIFRWLRHVLVGERIDLENSNRSHEKTTAHLLAKGGL